MISFKKIHAGLKGPYRREKKCSPLGVPCKLPSIMLAGGIENSEHIKNRISPRRIGHSHYYKLVPKICFAECIIRPSCLKDVVSKSSRVSCQMSHLSYHKDIAAIIATSRLSMLNRGYHRDSTAFITAIVLRSVKGISVELLLFPDDHA